MLEVSHTTVIEHAPMSVYRMRESQNKELLSCNSCIHNGSWTCIKCSRFDHYEKGESNK